MKLYNHFLVVGIAIFFIASTLSGKGIMHCLTISKPRYSNSFPAKKDFSAFTLKPAHFNLFRTLSNFLIWSSKDPKRVGHHYAIEHSLDH